MCSGDDVPLGHNEIIIETGNKHLETITAVWQGNFMSVESNDKKKSGHIKNFIKAIKMKKCFDMWQALTRQGPN